MNEHESSRAAQALTAGLSSQSRTRTWLGRRKIRWIASAALVAGLIGATVGIAASSSGASRARSATRIPHLAGYGLESGTSNARTAPAAMGTAVTINAVSSTSFTLATPTGQKATVDEATTATNEARGPPCQPSRATATTSQSRADQVIGAG